MSRREYRITFHCSAPGCREMYRTVADTRREERSIYERNKRSPWTCTRHRDPEKVLTPSNRLRVTTLTAHVPDGLDCLSWKGAGTGFIHGPGFKSFAVDMPKGTKVVVAAAAILPTKDVAAERRLVAADLLRQHGFESEGALLDQLGGRAVEESES